MLMNTIKPNRILAVEIRAARLGYAVLETPKQLCDFGALLFSTPRVARGRIARLLHRYQPAVLVLAGAGARYPRNMQSRRAIARIGKNEAKQRGIPSARISEKEFKTFFGQYFCRDKYDIAAVLAKWFPELAWRVPPPLDFYDPEPRQMLYFDSIALGIAYLLSTQNNKSELTDDRIFSPASK